MFCFTGKSEHSCLDVNNTTIKNSSQCDGMLFQFVIFIVREQGFGLLCSVEKRKIAKKGEKRVSYVPEELSPIAISRVSNFIHRNRMLAQYEYLLPESTAAATD